ncbi:MAG: hypothetical protein SGCHY_005633 [Lobulomycetales sp.]
MLGQRARVGVRLGVGTLIYFHCANAYATSASAFPPAPETPFWVPVYRILPLKRRPLYSAFISITGIDSSEIPLDLVAYPDFAALFSRSIDMRRLRPIDSDAALVSPADGRILHLARNVGPDRRITVKNTSYSLAELVAASTASRAGGLNAAADEAPWNAAVVYLAPRNYHRFHSPCDLIPKRLYHHTGETLYSVSPIMLERVPGLLHRNERVIMHADLAESRVTDALVEKEPLSPTAKGGWMAYVAVGATCVGSIEWNDAPALQTNNHASSSGKDNRVQQVIVPESARQRLAKGDEIGAFNFGSTIVLVWSGLPGEFCVSEGDAIRVGEAIFK